MKWIVLEENPKPDNYIAVVLAENEKRLQLQNRPHSVFADRDLALTRAQELRAFFGVRSIRVFQSEGCSYTIRPD